MRFVGDCGVVKDGLTVCLLFYVNSISRMNGHSPTRNSMQYKTHALSQIHYLFAPFLLVSLYLFEQGLEPLASYSDPDILSPAREVHVHYRRVDSN